MMAFDSLRYLIIDFVDVAPDVPDDKIVVEVVDQRGDAAVGVVLRKRGIFVLCLLRVEEDRLEGQAEFTEHHLHFPTGPMNIALSTRGRHTVNSPSIGPEDDRV